jgi:hypothetical protein
MTITLKRENFQTYMVANLVNIQISTPLASRERGIFELPVFFKFGFCNFGHLDLFDIWDLGFVI